MVSSDFRAEARRKLVGKWGTAVLITLVFLAFSFLLSLLESHTSGFANLVVSILTVVIDIPLSFGLVMTFLKLFNGEYVSAFSFFSLGFDNFGKSWSISWHIFLKILVPMILVVVSYVLIFAGTGYYIINDSLFAKTSSNTSGMSVGLMVLGFILLIVSLIWGITKSYYYQLAYLIGAEHQGITGEEAVFRSQKLMTNRRARLFFLEFSFIGWALLAALTFGIGILWLAPYMQFASIAFYKNALEETKADKVEE